MISNAKIACLIDVKPTKLFCARHIYLLAMPIHKLTKIQMVPKTSMILVYHATI
jgi:hypothetical protein